MAVAFDPTSAAPVDESPSGFDPSSATLADDTDRSWPQALGQETMAGAHGAERMGLGALNLFDKLPAIRDIPGGAGITDADLQDFDAQHAAEFGNNKTGKLIGEAAPMVAAQLIPGVDLGADSLAAGAGGRLLPRVLSMLARTGSAGAQGAAQAAATAPVGQQGDAAATGAALGAAGSLGTDALGSLARGIVGKSLAAQRLYGLAAQHGDSDFFIPVTQGGTGPVASAYRAAMPYTAFTHGPLERQGQQWQSAVRDMLGENAAPGDLQAAQQLLAGATSPQEAASRIRAAYNARYPAILANWQGSVPPDFASTVLDRVLADNPDMPLTTAAKVGDEAQGLLSQFAGAPSGLTGNGLQNVRQLLKARRFGNDVENFEKPAYDSAVGAVEDLMQGGLSPDEWQNFQDLNAGYNEAKPYLDAADGAVATRGAFKGAPLARAANDNSAAQGIGQDMAEVAGRPAAGSSNGFGRFGRAGELYELGKLAVAGHPVAAVAGAVLPRALASRTAQRTLYGDTGLQRTLAALAASNPNAARGLSAAARAALVGSQEH